jgi:energy-coupling factor transporter ATP-binding protein EcfA2
MAHATHQVLEQLEHALGNGTVPLEEKRRAAQLLSRLKSPVQVVLVGRSGSGKSRLINMITGELVVPDGADLPPLEIVYGPQLRTVYLMVDGSEQAHDGLRLDQPAPSEAAIVRAELPLDVLKRLSLTELSLAGSPADQRAIADWAMQRADIVLWCSQSFDASEQALWSTADEALKDHSFLVLTKADQLQMKGVLSDRIAELESVVAEEFFRMYPVATIQAISSGSADNNRDEDIWTASGGKALMDAVQRLVDTGRSADADNALMFINRFAPSRARAVAVKGEESGARQYIKTDDEYVEVQLGKESDGEHEQIFQKALEFLQSRADLMLGAVEENSPDKQTLILDHCLETANKLSEIMMEVDLGGTSLSDIQEDVLECSDMMVLFHLEKTEDAATDAVTLLFQIKKEMSVAAAT